MAKKQNKFKFESEEIKAKYIKEIIGFFQSSRNEQIGIIAAEEVLDFLFNTMGEEIYKKAVKDCQKILKERMGELEFELDLLLPSN